VLAIQLARFHQRRRTTPPLASPHSRRGVRLTLYRAKERGRQVLPPSFPSATLEIYYADREAPPPPPPPPVRGREAGEESGGGGNLKLYLPYARRTTFRHHPSFSLSLSLSLSLCFYLSASTRSVYTLILFYTRFLLIYSCRWDSRAGI